MTVERRVSGCAGCLLWLLVIIAVGFAFGLGLRLAGAI